MSRASLIARKGVLLFATCGSAVAIAAVLSSASGAATPNRVPTASATHTASTPWLPSDLSPAGSDWPTSGGDLAGSDYSTLTQINTSNVSKLKVAWQLPPLNAPGQEGFYRTEIQPLVLTSGPTVTNLPMATTMFVQTNYGEVALNPTNGSIIWQYKGLAFHNNRAGAPAVGIPARSTAYGDGMIFDGQQDGSLVALNAKTGAAVWTVDTEAAGTSAEGGVTSESNPYSVFDAASSTNKLAQDIVFSAPNGGDSPMRGHFDAYNAKTGALIWRTWTTPDPTQVPFILTWQDPAEAATGGAAVWSLPAVDNVLGKVYFGTGNHVPETGGLPGKKLWTDTVMAADLRTGALKWYFQTVHHDEWDNDESNPPVRINPVINGKRVPVVAIGGKGAYIFVLNANNGGKVPGFSIPEVAVPNLNNGQGQLLNSTYPTQPEPTGGAGKVLPTCLTPDFLAARVPGFPTAPNGTPIIPTCPYAPAFNNAYVAWCCFGGISFPREAYNPATNDLYVCGVINLIAQENISATSPNYTSIQAGGGQAGGTISALNMSTNKLDWQVVIPPGFETPGGPTTRPGSCYSGDMTTAGGLMFSSESEAFTDGTPPVPAEFDAFDAKTGKKLWSWINNQGGPIRAPAATYMVGNKQYVVLDVCSPAQPPATATTPPTDHLTVFSL